MRGSLKGFVVAAVTGVSMLNVQPAVSQSLPDPLLCLDGSRVTSPEEWRTRRRAEVLTLFQDNIYGRPTVGRPTNMTFRTAATDGQAMNGAATLKRIAVEIANDRNDARTTIDLVLFVPNGAARPSPAFLLINHRSASNTDPTRQQKSDFWPAEAVIARGYAVAAFHVDGVDPDNNNFGNGVHMVFDGGRRKGDGTWGALAAWAWGASRVMDYLESDGDVDHAQVAVVGHSRGGKAALVTGATDERFALTVSNCSGESGAAIARRLQGERIKDIVGSFPYWFCTRFATFVDRESDLPVDQHELVALIAPRRVYVASASNDAWADPEGEYQSLAGAAPVYALFGMAGMGTTAWPLANRPVTGEGMGYHMRQGDHNLTRYDWDRYMDFFDKARSSVTATAGHLSYALCHTPRPTLSLALHGQHAPSAIAAGHTVGGGVFDARGRLVIQRTGRGMPLN